MNLWVQSKLPNPSKFLLMKSFLFRKGGYSMHAIAEASNKDTLPKGISLAESQYVNLEHGSSRVGVLLKNNTDQAITLPSSWV